MDFFFFLKNVGEAKNYYYCVYSCIIFSLVR